MRLFGSQGHLAVLPKAFDDLHLHGAFRFLRRKGTAGKNHGKNLGQKNIIGRAVNKFGQKFG